MRNNQGRNIDVQNLGKSALVISNAVRLALTQVLVDLTRQGKLRMDEDGDYIYLYMDVNQQTRSQKLIIDGLTDNWHTVSFAGDSDFLEMIDSDGWESSITSVRDYLIAAGAEIEFDLASLNYYPVGRFSKTAEEDSVSYTVIINNVRDEQYVRELANSVGLEVLTHPEEENTTMNQNTNTASNGDAFDQAVHNVREGIKDGAAKVADSVAGAAETVSNKAENVADDIRGSGAATAVSELPWYKRPSVRYAIAETAKTGLCIAGVACVAGLAIRAIWSGTIPEVVDAVDVV